MFKPKPRSKQKDVTSCRFCGRFRSAAADELAKKVKEGQAVTYKSSSNATLRCFSGGSELLPAAHFSGSCAKQHSVPQRTASESQRR
jgi:hypothetical protein